MAFTQKAADIPLLKQKHDWLLAHSGDLPNSHVYREIRALFNRFPKRELFYASAPSLKDIIDRIVYMSGDDEIAVHARRGQGYMALSIAFSRDALLLRGGAGAAGGRWPASSGPSTSPPPPTWAR